MTKHMSTMDEYRNGGDGFIKWAEENACVPIHPIGSTVSVWTEFGKLPSTKHPDTGRSYKEMWKAQQVIIREALRMDSNGFFIHRLIIFCWPRGEGKSFIICLIMLWKFFCWPAQQIPLGANSKDQIKFVHYDIMRRIIWNSPKLLKKIGRRNIKVKDITIRNQKGETVSSIWCVSSFSGIFSNINGYTFSEIYAMKNEDFFNEFDGSVRNVPNAFGSIDSTVSPKMHVLYRLFEATRQGKDKTTFFSYRCSQKGAQEDYWHPYMTEKQLNSYRIKFPLGAFERFFLNLWTAGAENVFTSEMIEATNYFGADNLLQNHGQVIELVKKRTEIIDSEKKFNPEFRDKLWSQSDAIDKIEQRLWPVESVYTIKSDQGLPAAASPDVLTKLTDLFDTDWAILTGCDRADPMKVRTAARSIVTVIAKGLPGSRSAPHAISASIPHYFFALLNLVHVADSSIEGIKEVIRGANMAYDGVDMFCAERWGVHDAPAWLEEEDIKFDIIYPTYDRQKAGFVELYRLYETGRFKAPQCVVPGSKSPDILKEEPSAFMHNPLPGPTGPRGFYSAEKDEKYGIQDDVMYSVAWTIYGGRMLGINDFRARSNKVFFGQIFQKRDLLGNYR